MKIAAISAATPIGRLIRKIDCQPRLSTSAPPTSGPTATEPASTALQMPIAVPRSGPRNSFPSSGSAVANSSAPPAPWTARAMSRASGLPAAAHAADASVKIASPAMKTRLRPMMSASEAAGSSSAASGSVYASSAHCTSANEAFRSARIVGSAVVTTETSSSSMKVAAQTSTSVQARRDMVASQ